MTGIADIEARRRIVRALRAGDERRAFEFVSAHMPLVYHRMSRPFMTAEQRRVDLAALCATSLAGRRDDIVTLNREMTFGRRGNVPGGFICVVDLARSARDGDWRGACRRIGQIMQYDGREIRWSYLRNLLRAIAFPPAPGSNRREINWKMHLMATALRE